MLAVLVVCGSILSRFSALAEKIAVEEGNTENQETEDYLKDILSYMACNAKSGNKYLLEIDLSASSANQLDLIGKIQVNYYDEVRNKFNTSFVISATSLNNKILIAISCN